MKMKKITILYVDAAVEFGGSLVVIGNLIDIRGFNLEVQRLTKFWY